MSISAKRIRADFLLVGSLAVLALAARLVGLHHTSNDMRLFENWYGQMAAAGHWHGLSKDIGNYNAPFLYMLDVATFLPGALVIKIKAIWMIFDVLLAFFTYKLVGLAWPGRRVPVAAAILMLLVPTVVINASFWGQMDSMWASWALGGVYFLARGRYWWGVSLCTVAFAFKPQGAFIFPLIALLVLAGRTPWRCLLAVPAVYVALDIPALLAGRNAYELLTIYSLSRQKNIVSDLTDNAPSVYVFIHAPSAMVITIQGLGDIFTIALILGICYVIVARGLAITQARIIQAATLFAVLTPFFLPGMHERYFFLGDVMSVVLIFFRPRLWYVPLLIQSSSLLAYEPSLFHAVVQRPVGAALMLAAILVLAYDLLREAFVRPSVEIGAVADDRGSPTTHIVTLPKPNTPRTHA